MVAMSLMIVYVHSEFLTTLDTKWEPMIFIKYFSVCMEMVMLYLSSDLFFFIVYCLLGFFFCIFNQHVPLDKRSFLRSVTLLTCSCEFLHLYSLDLLVHNALFPHLFVCFKHPSSVSGSTGFEEWVRSLSL